MGAFTTMTHLNKLKCLQCELIKMQYWIKQTGYKLVLIFEGRDTAGKGGSIKRFMEHLNPRGARVVALNKPTLSEQHQWYFQRYIKHLPTAGEIVLFDRSWYNRAGVEYVMKFCKKKERQQFLQQVSEFEKLLVSSDIHLIKFWFSVTKEEQAKRLEQRKQDPLKQWKLTEIDRQAQDYWQAYTEAKNFMFSKSHKPFAPWTIIHTNQKRHARLQAINYVLYHVDYQEKNTGLIKLPDSQLVYSPDERTDQNF